MKINKKYIEFIFLNAINCIFFLVLLISSKFGDLKWIFYILFIGIYIIYLLRKSNVVIVKYLISFLLISSVCLDTIYIKTLINTPMEIKYVIDIISSLLLFKIIVNIKRYKLILKDPVFVLIIISIISSIVLFIIHNEGFKDLIDFINGFRIYYRCIPIYLVLSIEEFDFKVEYYLYYIFNIIAFAFETFRHMHQDNRTGLFGASGTSAFSIFVLIMLVISLVQYLNKKKSLRGMLFILFITIMYFVISENKAFIFLTLFLVGISSIIASGRIRKKLTILISTILIALIGINILNTLFPGFTDMFNLSTMGNSISSYLLNNNNSSFEMGRIEAASYVAEIELDTEEKKLFGIGIGSALPPENWYLSTDNKARGRKIIDFQESKLYSKYGGKIGYYLTSFGVLYIESGIVGILVLLFIYSIIIRRCIYIIKNSNNIYQSIIGFIGIFTMISIIFPVLYGGALLSREFMVLLFIIIGSVTYTYNIIKTNRNFNKN